jgi:hypothetical protein
MDFEGGFADLLVWSFLLAVTQSIAALVVDGYRRNQEHPLDDLLRAIALIHQEELPAIREALDRIAERGESDE